MLTKKRLRESSPFFLDLLMKIILQVHRKYNYCDNIDFDFQNEHFTEYVCVFSEFSINPQVIILAQMTSKAQKNVDNNNVKKESPLFFLACCRQFSNMTNSRPAAKFFDLKQPQNYDGKKPLFYNIADSRISLFSITFIFHFSCMPSFIGH